MIVTLPMICLGVTPMALVRPPLFMWSCYRNIPGRVVLDSLMGTRLLAGLFLWNCQRQMKYKFRTRSTFDIRYMQEIKYILFGNVGDFDKFNDEDKRVIKEVRGGGVASALVVFILHSNLFMRARRGGVWWCLFCILTFSCSLRHRTSFTRARR